MQNRLSHPGGKLYRNGTHFATSDEDTAVILLAAGCDIDGHGFSSELEDFIFSFKNPRKCIIFLHKFDQGKLYGELGKFIKSQKRIYAIKKYMQKNATITY